MRLITLEDVRDIYLKAVQRGAAFVLSKLSLSGKARTKSSFNDVNIQSANWWIIPEVRKRWNKLITGDSDVTYEEFLTEEIFTDKRPLKMLSIGSGVCSHELKLAGLNPHWNILCVDFSDKVLAKAKETAEADNLKNIRFFAGDIYTAQLPDEYYDIILFHSSLHHFENLAEFIPDKVVSRLTEKGKLIINEFVGASRLQYPKSQLRAINEGLRLIDVKYRTMFKSTLKKNACYGSGVLRMILSDPSECVDSESIMPVIYKHFNVLVEKPMGGNILMSALKDIAHHFAVLDDEKRENLNRIFQFEDEYIRNHKSDFIFGVYEKK